MSYVYKVGNTKRKVSSHCGPISLPYDYTMTIPDVPARWIKQYLPQSLLYKYKIGYSESKNQSIILPVYKDRMLVAYQARSFDPDCHVKYKSEGPKVLFNSNTPTIWDCVVITEDQISAIKVGQVTRSLAILGNWVTEENMIEIGKQKAKLYLVWLDNDKGGDIGRANLFELRKYAPVRILTTAKDPKSYSFEEIKDHITCACMD